MRKLVLAFIFSLNFATAQSPKPQDLRGILLEQLRTTHDKQEWFVPASLAIQGLTAEQAKWRDKSGNHSIGQLVNHLAFWDERELQKFKGGKSAAFSGNNEETFNDFDATSWTALTQRLDRVLKEWEDAVSTADEARIRASASVIAHIGAHNAYHTGQIIYIRRLQGSWDPSKGVK